VGGDPLKLWWGNIDAAAAAAAAEVIMGVVELADTAGGNIRLRRELCCWSSDVDLCELGGAIALLAALAEEGGGGGVELSTRLSPALPLPRPLLLLLSLDGECWRTRLLFVST